jgi:hypothetical protein
MTNLPSTWPSSKDPIHEQTPWTECIQGMLCLVAPPKMSSCYTWLIFSFRIMVSLPLFIFWAPHFLVNIKDKSELSRKLRVT